MKLRILEVIRQGEVGGGESHVIDLVRGLRHHTDVEPVVLAFTDGAMIEQLRKDGTKCFVIPSTRAFDPVAMYSVARLMRSEGIHIVHAHGSRAATNIMLVCRWLHIPYIYTVHGWSFHEGQGTLSYNLRQQSERWICNWAKRVICVSSSNLATGTNAFGLLRSKAVVIENGINLERFNADGIYPDIRRELGIDSDAFLVAFICRITEQKGPLVFVRAIEQAASRNPRLRALMVGEGDMQAEVDDYIRQHSLQRIIYRQPFRSDVPALLAAADVFCLPSLWEGLSIAMLEAMAMRKAMVVTMTDGARDVISDGLNALVVPPASPEVLANAFLRLANEPATCAALGNAAHMLVSERFNAQRVADAVHDIYSTLSDPL